MKSFIQPEIKAVADKLGEHAKNLEGKTILISGASGFLGGYFIGSIQHLNKTVFSKPCKIVAIDNFITGSKKHVFIDTKDKNLTFLKRDVSKPLDIPGKADYIVHAAGLASPVYYAKYPLETIDATVGGVRNMLDLARKKKPRAFLYFSSSEIYGNPHTEHIPTKETYHGHVSSVGLRACYDESKRMGETLCTVYHRMYGVPVSIVRPFNVYGPGMKANDYRVLPNFLMAALHGRTIEIHNNGLQTRTFCYATDAVDGFFRVLFLGKPGEAYNIGSDDDEITMHELAKRTEKVFGKKLKIKEAKYPEGYPVGDPERRRPDLSKARTHLGYAPSVPLEEGLGKMFTWYRKLLELE